MNLRPSGYEPDELPDCSTPRRSGPSTLATLEPGANLPAGCSAIRVSADEPEVAADRIGIRADLDRVG